MRRWPLRLGLQLGLFQLGIGLFGVLSLGLFNRLLIEEMRLPAVLAAVAIGSQQLMGFTRVWFGNRSDRIPLSRLRRTPFIVGSSLALALLFALACQLLLLLGITGRTLISYCMFTCAERKRCSFTGHRLGNIGAAAAAAVVNHFD